MDNLPGGPLLAERLDKAVRAVCPISGVSIGRRQTDEGHWDRSSWGFVPQDSATDFERAEAQRVIDTFDPDGFGAAESDAIPLPPDPGEGVLGPLEELKAKIDQVRKGKVDLSGVDDLEPLTPDDLIKMVSDVPPGAAAELENAVKAIRGENRRRFTELLNIELAELENLRNAGMAGADPKREQDIEYLLGLFARLGEI